MGGTVAYVLTTAGDDLWSAMTRVSVASLRLSNPWAKVILGCDMQSASALADCRHPLLSEVDEVLSVRTPDGPASVVSLK